MKISFRVAYSNETDIALGLLKQAAYRLKSKEINQWQYWINPSAEKIQWIMDGFENKEFNFILDGESIIGMFRLLDIDELYWGKKNDHSNYLHSLVIINDYVGLNIGRDVLKEVIHQSKGKGISFFRLDCNASNTKLCKFYESIGFKKVGEVDMPHSLNNLYQIIF